MENHMGYFHNNIYVGPSRCGRLTRGACTSPSDFDVAMKKAKSTSNHVYVLLTGAKTDGISWCPVTATDISTPASRSDPIGYTPRCS
jgi:hypothetical protein